MLRANAEISSVPIFLGFLFLSRCPSLTRRLTSKGGFWRLGLAELSGTYGPHHYPLGWARYHLLEDSGVCLNTIVDLGPKLRQPLTLTVTLRLTLWIDVMKFINGMQQ